MLKVITPFLFSFVIYSCYDDKALQNSKTKTIEIGVLKISVSAQDSFIKRDGIDSYVAYIINNENDTFHLEYGKKNIIYNLFDVPPKGLPLKDKEALQRQLGKLPPPDEAVFTKTPEEDNLQNVFQKSFYLYDTINGLTVKIAQPKKIGQGMTGLYIPELRDGNSFSIYTKNLDSASHRSALAMFSTISYR